MLFVFPHRPSMQLLVLRNSCPAIAAFCYEQHDTYIVVFGGQKRNGDGDGGGGVKEGGTGDGGATTAGGAAAACVKVFDARLRLLCRFNPFDCEVRSTGKM